MPPTREQRDAHQLCGAKTKSGSPCRMFAGQGTSHVGIGRCFRHGGASPNHEKHAAKISLQQRLHSEAEALTGEEAQPHRVLKNLLQQTGGRLRWLDKEIAREHSAEAERMFKQERQFVSWGGEDVLRGQRRADRSLDQAGGGREHGEAGPQGSRARRADRRRESYSLSGRKATASAAVHRLPTYGQR